MRKIKQTIVIFAAALLLLPFFSCRSETAKEPVYDSGQDMSDAQNIAGAEPNQSGYDSLQVIDYGGAEFVIANMDGYTWTDVTLDVEAEETGELLNDAIYRRNRAVEEKYNITFKVIPIQYTTIKTKIRNQFDAGYCEYDITQAPMGHDVMTLSVENYIADANKLKNLDLTNPWWDHFAHESTSICGRQFFLFGDFTIADKEYATAIFFNKQMQQAYGLPDYYQMVRDGTWTIDNMLDSMKAVTTDLNGDGKWTKDDQYGLVVNTASSIMTFYGAGETMVKKDAGDIPYWTVDKEPYINAFARMCEFMNTGNATAEAFALGSHQDTMFAEGKALFDCTLISSIRAPEGGTQSFRDVDNWDFGLLPPPKLNEQQQRYYSLMDGLFSPCIAIVNNESERAERAAMVLEALNAKSSEDVRTKYYELALPAKYIRDEDSFEMIEWIMNNRIFDLAQTYNWGNISEQINNLFNKNKADQLVSYIEQNLEKADIARQEDIDKIRAFD